MVVFGFNLNALDQFTTLVIWSPLIVSVFLFLRINILEREVKLFEVIDELRKSKIKELNITKNGVYQERNVLVSGLTSVFPAGIRETEIEGWHPDWNGCVFIDLPTGQISFHYHVSEAHLFDHLPPYTKDFDGHDKKTVLSRIISLNDQSGV